MEVLRGVVRAKSLLHLSRSLLHHNRSFFHLNRSLLHLNRSLLHLNRSLFVCDYGGNACAALQDATATCHETGGVGFRI